MTCKTGYNYIDGSAFEVSRLPSIAGSISSRHTISHRESLINKSNPCELLLEKEVNESFTNISKTLLTGSSYTGSSYILGMQGKGKYIFPDGKTIYEGDFVDNQFHGYGRLIYPNGTIVYGRWWCGKLICRKIVFHDTVLYADEDWKYLDPNDRRYSIEHKIGLSPAGRSLIINSEDLDDENIKPDQPLSGELYSTIDGFYNTKLKMVYDTEDTKWITRVPTKNERDWIESNCRKLNKTPRKIKRMIRVNKPKPTNDS